MNTSPMPQVLNMAKCNDKSDDLPTEPPSRKTVYTISGTNATTDSASEDEEGDGSSLTYCGVGNCKPSFAQVCKNMICFTLAYSANVGVTSSLSVYINSQITTLEKQFNFSSSVSGMLMSCNEFGFLVTNLVVSFYTRRLHVPRALAVSSLVFGLSALLCVLPYLGIKSSIPRPIPTTPQNGSEVSAGSAPICTLDSRAHNMSCLTTSSDDTKAFLQISDNWRGAAIAIIAVSMVIQGVTKGPRMSFGGTYLEDNLPKTKVALYMGLATGLYAILPAAAFALGGYFSDIYVTLEETSMSPRDPRWLGAWWLGFLVFGLLSLLISVPMVFFPRSLATRKPTGEVKKIRKLHPCRDLKEFVRALLRLVLNPAYMCVVLGMAVNALAVVGMGSFLPKYLETQFNMVTSETNITLGVLNLLAVVSGVVVGGWLTSRYKLSPVKCLQFMAVTTFISNGVMCLGFLLGCDQPVIFSDGLPTLRPKEIHTSNCIKGCNCDPNNYFPICGNDNRNYFSPCYAGCLSMEGSLFTNCTCLGTDTTTARARGGLCAGSCWTYYPFLAMLFVSFFFGCLIYTPSFIVSVRLVKEEDKPLSIAFFSFTSSLIGFFSGPIVFGNLIDTTCIIWKTVCSSVGACALYDIELFRFRYFAMFIGLRSATVLFFCGAVLIVVCSKNRLVHHPTGDSTDHSSTRTPIQAVDQETLNDVKNMNV